MAQIDKEFIETYFDKGVDIDNRRIFLIGELDDESIGNAIKALYLIEGESESEPCEAFINSSGGSITATLALYDVINTVKCPIRTFAVGQCMSAAPLLLAAGEKGERWVGENCMFMTHQGSDDITGKFSDLQSAVKFNIQLDKVWLELIAKNSNKPFSFWARKSLKGADFYFGAEEAIEWGIADSIWNEKE
jgi:ATP-dependent Clp protease protease subunit